MDAEDAAEALYRLTRRIEAAPRPPVRRFTRGDWWALGLGAAVMIGLGAWMAIAL
jgi:hypothetical protein